MMPGLENGKVLDNRQVAGDWYVMDVAAPATARQCQPGQFLHIRPADNYDPLLRRPLSIYDVVPDSGLISLLYRVVGRGTGLLAKFAADEFINIMGPLGRGWSMPASAESLLLVGGGIGVAPLMYLARVARQKECRVRLLFGASEAAQLSAAARFEKLGVEVKRASMDGSLGYPGRVTDLLNDEIATDYARVYTCGPAPMMALVARWAITSGVWGEVSLEEHMACGVGACLGCACQLDPFQPGYVKVCKDGPVFNVDQVRWMQQMPAGEVTGIE